MIRRPDEVYIDPRIVALVVEVLRHNRSGPSMAQPTREQLRAALARQHAQFATKVSMIPSP